MIQLNGYYPYDLYTRESESDRQPEWARAERLEYCENGMRCRSRDGRKSAFFRLFGRISD